MSNKQRAPSALKKKQRPAVKEPPSAIKRLKATPQWVRWSTIVDSAKQFPIDKHLAEIASLHSARRSRGLVGRAVSVDALIQSNGQDASMRSRAAELQVFAFKLSNDLGRVNRAMRDFLTSEKYLDGSTITDRKSQADRLLSRGVSLEGKLDSFIETMNIYINDIDQCGYSLKRLSDLIAMKSKPEFSV